MSNTNELEERRLNLATVLFNANIDRATWQDILDEITALVYQYDRIKQTFKRIGEENELDLLNRPLPTQADLIRDDIGRTNRRIEDLEDEIKELEKKLETADRSQAVFNLFSDLGFDTTCLKDNMDPSKLVDITDPSVVSSLKNQIERM